MAGRLTAPSSRRSSTYAVVDAPRLIADGDCPAAGLVRLDVRAQGVRRLLLACGGQLGHAGECAGPVGWLAAV
jgi:hypothetical protein